MTNPVPIEAWAGIHDREYRRPTIRADEADRFGRRRDGSGRLSTGRAARGTWAAARGRRRRRLELVDDLAQRLLGGDDLRRERLRLGLDGAGLVGVVLGVLERVDGVDELVGQPGDALADRVDALATTAPPRARRGTGAAAGRIIVEAMSMAQLASMFWTLT